MLVATRYLPQEHLIGPALFPLYRFVLKIVAACYLLPWMLVWVGFLAFDRSFRPAHGGSSWFRTLGAFWADFWVVPLVALAVVTTIFAVLERRQGKTALLTTWDPRKLSPARDPNRISRAASIFELATGVVFSAWWIAAMAGPVVLEDFHVRVTLAPVWPWFYWGYVAIAVASLALTGANLLQPWWTRRRAALRLLLDLAGVSLFCVLCASNVLSEVAVEGMAPTQTRELTRQINMWAARAVPMVAAVGLVILAFDVYRILRADGLSERVTPPAGVNE